MLVNIKYIELRPQEHLPNRVFKADSFYLFILDIHQEQYR